MEDVIIVFYRERAGDKYFAILCYVRARESVAEILQKIWPNKLKENMHTFIHTMTVHV